MRPETSGPARRNGTPARYQAPALADAEALPPYSGPLEEAALGCVLLAGGTSQPEARSMLDQLTADLFYNAATGLLLAELKALLADRHAIDLVVVVEWLEKRDKLDSVGGYAALSGMMNNVPSVIQFRSYLDELQALAHKRWLLSLGAEIKTLATRDGMSLEETRTALAGMLAESESRGRREPLIELMTPDDILNHIPDPASYLVGQSLIKVGQLSALAGWWGLGKSRCAHALALAGARGGTWMGYEVRRRFRTLILQSENDEDRLKDELAEHLRGVGDWIRISRPTFLDLPNPQFRSELKAIKEGWPFDLLIIDPWTDVAGKSEAEDVQAAMFTLLALFGRHMPAILAVAHTRKQRGGDQWRPKSAPEMVHEVQGSFTLVAKARTVCILQPASMDADDPRVVFGVGKSNNQVPLPMTAWERANGSFRPVGDFDWDEYWNPPDNRRRSITEEQMASVFLDGRRALERKAAKEAIRALGFEESTAYKYLDLKRSPFKDRLDEREGLLTWR